MTTKKSSKFKILFVYLEPNLRLSFLTYYDTKLFILATTPTNETTNCNKTLITKQVISVKSNYDLPVIDNQLVYYIFNEFEVNLTSTQNHYYNYSNYLYRAQIHHVLIAAAKPTHVSTLISHSTTTLVDGTH